MSELPKGWENTTLGDVCSKPQYGYTTKADPALGEVKFLRTTDITKGQLNWDTVPFCMESPAESSKYQLVEGDIVIARSGSVGVSYLIDKAYEPAVFASYLIRFKPITPVLSQYVKAFLDSHLFWEQVEVNKAGNALQNINAQKLSAMSFLLAPLPEQKRIVEKLDEVLAQVDTIKARLNGIPDLLKRFRQSVLASAVSGKLTEEWRTSNKSGEVSISLIQAEHEEFFAKSGKKYKKPIRNLETLPNLEIPESWILCRAEELCDLITKGTTPKKDAMSPEYEIPYIKVYNLTFDGRLDFSVDPTFVSQKTHSGELKRSIVYPGDVLMNIVGPPLGKVSIVPDTYPEWNLNQAISIFRPVCGVSSRYLSLCLMDFGLLEITKAKAKATAGQFNLTLEICRDYPIPVPATDEQKEIVRLVDQYFAFADTIEAQVKKAQARVDNLTQSILAKAFRGELVPQDENDEPADKLLERIAQARAEAEALAKEAKKLKAAKKRAAKAAATK